MSNYSTPSEFSAPLFPPSSQDYNPSISSKYSADVESIHDIPPVVGFVDPYVPIDSDKYNYRTYDSSYRNTYSTKLGEISSTGTVSVPLGERSNDNPPLVNNSNVYQGESV
jgi:hypothetical protein